MSNNSDKVILGIDPGLKNAGFAILKSASSKLLLLDLGCLSQKSTLSLVERVGRFSEFFADKIKTHQVTNISLETPFLGKNAQVFLKLGYLRGVLYSLAYQNNLTLTEFAPREIKKAVTSSGAADKNQVAQSLFMLFPQLKIFPQTNIQDVTDALAIGLCAFF